MTPVALKALKGSIRKWQKIVDGTGEDRGPDNCPLCQQFFEKNCVGCPVRMATGKPRCGSTPYDDWGCLDTAIAYDDNAIVIAVKELRFLKGLLPKPKSR